MDRKNAEADEVRRELHDIETILRGVMPGTLCGDTLAKAVADEVRSLRRMLGRATLDELQRLRLVRDNIETLYRDKHTPRDLAIILAVLCGPLVTMDPTCARQSTTGLRSSINTALSPSSSRPAAPRPATRKTKRSSGSKR